MILIFIIFPLFWMWLLGSKYNIKERLLLGIGFFWLLIIPIMWGLYTFGNFLVSVEMFWFLVCFISLVLVVNKIRTDGWVWMIRLPKFKPDWSLVLVVLCFTLMHIFFYSLYQTMPESDGYINIIRLKDMVKTGVVGYQYRPLFYVAMMVLGQVTKIDLYQIHTFWMIVISGVYLLTLSLLIEKNKIKNFGIKSLVLFSALAVPVINMEIDFFRPQSLFLILFPIIFYLEQNNKNYMALGISLLAMGYHQFFIFPVLVLLVKFFFNFSRVKKKLFIIVGVLLVMLFHDHIINYLPINRIFDNIGQIEKWRWWFLGSYKTIPDNIEMGWPGLSGALMYYGYYFGPIVLIGLLLMVLNIKKLLMQKYWLLFIGLLIFVSEVLPRLNVVYLPERFPLLIDLTVVLLLPFLINRYKKFTILWSLLICIGIFGSGYIAWLKGSLTNKQEVKAATWINSNTDKDAMILTQRSNEIMIKYFADRTFVNPGKMFFDGNFIGDYFIDSIRNNPIITRIDNCYDCYILYSYHKFGGMRELREYWNECNYKDVDLNKFNLLYKKVYDENGIVVWKIDGLN